MTTEPFRPATNFALICLSISLLTPSMAVFQKYLGITGVVVYLAIASLVLWIGYRYAMAWFASIVRDRWVPWLTAATFLFISAVFFVGYPLSNSGILGRGSDGDEALNTATMDLLKAKYPYYHKTYLGNPITPLPGSLVLAAPFVLSLGNGAYQNLFWILAFFFTMNSFLKNMRSALLLLWAILALSPVVLREIATGGDYSANSLYVMLPAMWMVSTIPKSNFSQGGKLLLAALLGIGLASRANFIFVLPLVYSALVQSAGLKSATKYVATTCLFFGLMTIPFYLYDPQGFSPLHVTDKFDDFRTIIPFPAITIAAVTGAISLILAIYLNSSVHALLRNCAIVLAFPVLAGTVLQSIRLANPDFSFTWYGTFFLFFGAAAYWPVLLGKTPMSPPDAIWQPFTPQGCASQVNTAADSTARQADRGGFRRQP